MHYMVAVKTDRGWKHLHDYQLDGIVPEHVVELMSVASAADLGLCENCEQAYHCHVLVWIAPHTYAKYCPVLWHDVFKPKGWKVEDLV
jgi:hypothetical protein